MVPVALSLCLTVILPPPSYLQPRLLPLVGGRFCILIVLLDLEFYVYEMNCKEHNLQATTQLSLSTYCFPKKRIVGQVLICSIDSIHEHIILKNTNRLLYLSLSPLNINHTRIVEIMFTTRVSLQD
jgi:hypothetical protein